MATTCYIWGSTNVLWSNANWRWSECSSSTPPIPVVDVGNLPGVDAEMLIQPWNPYQTSSIDKRKRLIKLICKVKGEEYNEEKELKNLKVTIGDIRQIIKTSPDIGLELKQML